MKCEEQELPIKCSERFNRIEHKIDLLLDNEMKHIRGWIKTMYFTIVGGIFAYILKMILLGS